MQIVVFLAILVIILAAVRLSLQSFIVDGTSMTPSFQTGEWLTVDKVTYHFRSPSRGDVIIFHKPDPTGELLIKRIIGLPGEHVEIKSGLFYINGQRLEETLPGQADLALVGFVNSAYSSVLLGEDEYYVIGDNRSTSAGSNTFGPVSRGDIVGRMWLSYWPLSHWGFSPHYEWETAGGTVASTVKKQAAIGAGCSTAWISRPS
ncbi:MAG: signal peptidase I [Chloroflexi bacterium]|nr:signal peptidase I [Chloroflexota bacterium]